MRNGGGFLLVAVGLLLLYMAITGKLDCLSAFADCVLHGSGGGDTASTPSNFGGGFGNVFKLPGTTIDSIYGPVSPGGRTSVWGPGKGENISTLPRLGS